MKKILIGLAILVTITGTASAFEDDWSFDLDWEESDEKQDDWSTDWNSEWNSEWDADFDFGFDEGFKEGSDKYKEDKKKDRKGDEPKEPEKVYWQVDFAEGDIPIPPSYWPRDLMAGLGNSVEGPTENPANFRLRNESELEPVNIEGESLQFDDVDNPTQATVSFTVDEGAEPRKLHLASFSLPGPFDIDELDEQELYDSDTGTFEGGDEANLTVALPTQ